MRCNTCCGLRFTFGCSTFQWSFQLLRPLLRCQRGDEVQSLLRHSSKRLSSGPLLCCSRLRRNRGCNILLSSAEEPAVRLPSQAFMFAGLRRCLIRVLTSNTADYCLSPLCELYTLRCITPPPFSRRLPRKKGGISDSPVNGGVPRGAENHITDVALSRALPTKAWRAAVHCIGGRGCCQALL